MNLYEHLFPAGGITQLWVLIDPDSISGDRLAEVVKTSEKEGVSTILVGGSMLVSDTLDQVIRSIKELTHLPVVLFPGSSRQISRYADGILFMSLLSGRNPQYLIGEQVHSAPIIKNFDLTAISTAYLLIESGRVTSAEFISDTRPIPRDKPEIAVAHALAAELLGMSVVYLEAGSGAMFPVPPEIITAVKEAISIPVIVGGGIKSAEDALTASRAGARAIIVGTAVERKGCEIIGEIASVIGLKRTV